MTFTYTVANISDNGRDYVRFRTGDVVDGRGPLTNTDEELDEILAGVGAGDGVTSAYWAAKGLKAKAMWTITGGQQSAQRGDMLAHFDELIADIAAELPAVAASASGATPEEPLTEQPFHVGMDDHPDADPGPV